MAESAAPSTEYQRCTSTPPRWYEWLPLPGLLAFAMNNHYQSASAAARVPRTTEALVPLDAHTARATPTAGRRAISDFATMPGRPGTACANPASFAGRVLLAPTTRPGLPAPLAWTLSAASRQDLTDQRADLFADPSDVGSKLLAVLSGRTALKCS